MRCFDVVCLKSSIYLTVTRNGEQTSRVWKFEARCLTSGPFIVDPFAKGNKLGVGDLLLQHCWPASAVRHQHWTHVFYQDELELDTQMVIRIHAPLKEFSCSKIQTFQSEEDNFSRKLTNQNRYSYVIRGINYLYTRGPAYKCCQSSHKHTTKLEELI